MCSAYITFRATLVFLSRHRVDERKRQFSGLNINMSAQKSMTLCLDQKLVERAQAHVGKDNLVYIYLTNNLEYYYLKLIR